MRLSVFGTSSGNDSFKTLDKSSFVQKPYLRTKCIKSNMEEDIDMKNQFRNKNRRDPISIREIDWNNSVDHLFNDPGTIKNTTDIDFNNAKVGKYKICLNQLSTNF